MFGRKHAAIEPEVLPRFPEPLDYLWDYFHEIVSGLQGNGWTYPLITWECLGEWSRLTGRELNPREARTIIRLGSMRAAILSEVQKKTDGGKG